MLVQLYAKSFLLSSPAEDAVLIFLLIAATIQGGGVNGPQYSKQQSPKPMWRRKGQRKIFLSYTYTYVSTYVRTYIDLCRRPTYVHHTYERLYCVPQVEARALGPRSFRSPLSYVCRTVLSSTAHTIHMCVVYVLDATLVPNYVARQWMGTCNVLAVSRVLRYVVGATL